MDDWYSIRGFNDPMSSLTHLVGAVVFAVLSLFLLIGASRNRSTFWFSFQFAVCSIVSLTMSFVYHMMAMGTGAREVMLRLDVAAIFCLIASTFTAIHGILFVGWRRWSVIGLLWTIAIIGIVVRTFFFDRLPEGVGSAIFLVMGWIGAYSSYLLWARYRWHAVGPVLLGGVFYTIGAVINVMGRGWVLIDRVWGPHETFHLFVLAGLGMHWYFVWSIADGSMQKRIDQFGGEVDLN